MHVYIIDNGSKYTKSLTALFPESKTTIIGYSEIDKHSVSDTDIVVLSGGHGNPVLWHSKEYAQEIQLVQSHSGPVIGICLGFQLLVHVFGAHFHLLEKRRKGLYKIKTTVNSDILPINAEYTVYENHNWSAQKVSSPLISLATSEDGVEIVKHIDRPIYALQFHPEGEGKNDGRMILRTILNAVDFDV